ncbi:MAG TPA: hypothetical protein VHH52_07390, partial [Pseudonocardiaceae bacterium]|nr:hypothetical protein [Pseudonocardiaceae bacterium]
GGEGTCGTPPDVVRASASGGTAMPWDQIVTAVALVALGLGGWLYGWRPERPPRRSRVPFAK